MEKIENGQQNEKAALYHASPTANINVLEPRISNHGERRVYFSDKRENVLVYLSNAVEKYCKEMDFTYKGIWEKWAAYGFAEDGRIRVEEYYPDALYDTYKGVSGYIYSTDNFKSAKKLKDIKDVYFSDIQVKIDHCEYIEDAYDAIMEAEMEGKIVIKRYTDLSEREQAWLEETIKKEYARSEKHPEYRFFLKSKFPFLSNFE